MDRKKVGIVILTSVLLCVFVAWLRNDCLLGIDDADIFFSYAENFASGRGITYGHNGVPVEGMTSFLWFLVCSLNFFLNLDEVGVFVWCTFLLLVTQALWLNLLGRFFQNRNFHIHLVAYIVLILGSPGYVPWMSITLMDTALWGFFVAWMSHSLLDSILPGELSRRKCLLHSILFLAAPLVRPESMLVVPGLLVIILFANIREKKKLFFVLAWCGGFLLSLGLLTAFRMSYFGYPFPNTFYAKVSPSFFVNLAGGLSYVGQFVLSGSTVAALAVCGLCSFLRGATIFYRSRSTTQFLTSPVFCLWVWCCILILPPILTGGDHFGYFRFFQPVYPLMVILIILSFDSLIPWKRLERQQRHFAGTIVLILLMSSVLGWKDSWFQWKQTPVIHHFIHSQIGREQGRCLNEIFESQNRKPVVGVIAAGGIARTYAGPIVDVLGLNNLEIAHFPGRREGVKNHAAFEPEAFDKTNTDILLAGPYQRFATILKDVFQTADFASRWRFVTFWDRDHPSIQISALAKKQYLEELNAEPSIGIWDALIWDGEKWKRNPSPCPIPITGTDPALSLTFLDRARGGRDCWRLPPGHVLWW